MDLGPPVAGLPRSRGERAAWLIGIGSLVAAAGATMLTHQARWIIAATAIGLGATWLHYRSWRAAKAWLRRHRWKVCDHCRYPLDRLAAEGTCPECGAAYVHARVAARWRAAYATYWKDPVDLGSYELPDDEPPPAHEKGPRRRGGGPGEAGSE